MTQKWSVGVCLWLILIMTFGCIKSASGEKAIKSAARSESPASAPLNFMVDLNEAHPTAA